MHHRLIPPRLAGGSEGGCAQVATSVLFSALNVDPVKLAQAVGANYVHPCWERYPNPSSLLTPEWVARVREADLGIVCWHEERPEEIAALSRIGVDGICSDAPELLIQIENLTTEARRARSRS